MSKVGNGISLPAIAKPIHQIVQYKNHKPKLFQALKKKSIRNDHSLYKANRKYA